MSSRALYKSTYLSPLPLTADSFAVSRIGLGLVKLGWVHIFTGRLARSAAMPVLFLLSGPKMGFRSAGATCYSHKREIFCFEKVLRIS